MHEHGGKARIRVWQGEALPASLAGLQDAARQEGFRHIDRLEAECFGPEVVFFPLPAALCMILQEQTVIGIGGLTRDPYDPAPQRLRMRHFYVHPAHRRAGHAKTLVQSLLARLPTEISHLTLFTSPDACGFWEASGFVRVNSHPSRSHERIIDKGSCCQTGSPLVEQGLA